MEYDPKKIEPKWQKVWEKQGIYRTKDRSKKPKFYVLDMFPYLSGAGLHVGHFKGYIATDVVARMKFMQGYNVLHPMGWDAFGLPTENFAIKHKVHPKVTVKENVKRCRGQFKKIGPTYDWPREINTTEPDYYKWTQWIFLQMFKKGLVYESSEPVNWCPKCQTGLANEDVEGGKCERCGASVERRPMRQWVLKMTAYAERLLKDLGLLDWEESIIEQQRNWIGKSEGAEIEFRIKNYESGIKVFTTRLDTIFGCTYVVVAPEHNIISKIKNQISNLKEVNDYIKKAGHKSDLERTDLAKEKTGVELKGIKAVNPFNQEAVPVFVADYVLPYYGTGAIMAVPNHDSRDFAFAKRYGLPMRQVILPCVSKSQIPMTKPQSNPKPQTQNGLEEEAFEENGILINSGQFTGLKSEEAREKMVKYAEEKGFGKQTVYYKMHDWVFSRQRYWGEPIPLVFCDNCRKKLKGNPKPETRNPKLKERFNQGELLNPGWVALPEEDLPLKLPEVKHYEPTGTGESPLVNIKNWVKARCPKCGSLARRETNTMPQWAGSCWYYLAYIMRGNQKSKIKNQKCPLFTHSKSKIKNNKYALDKNKKKIDYWMPVDLYVGGAEHATRHLLYARFWHKFLYDIGSVFTKEPFKKLRYVGLILAEDGRKMSKRWGNVITPDDVIDKFGADSLRLYEMFMGPFDQSIAWNMQGVMGTKRFLQKVWGLFGKSLPCRQAGKIQNFKLEKLVHQTIKKVTEDIENFKFNTAISALMILVNEMEKQSQLSWTRSGLPGGMLVNCQLLLKLLAPFAPHIAEELWSRLQSNRGSSIKSGHQLGSKKSIFQENWPKYDPELAKKERITLIIQINGKVRDKIEAAVDISEEEAKKLTFSREKVKKWIEDKPIKKVIFVKGRLVNIVV